MVEIDDIIRSDFLNQVCVYETDASQLISCGPVLLTPATLSTTLTTLSPQYGAAEMTQ